MLVLRRFTRFPGISSTFRNAQLPGHHRPGASPGVYSLTSVGTPFAQQHGPPFVPPSFALLPTLAVPATSPTGSDCILGIISQVTISWRHHRWLDSSCSGQPLALFDSLGPLRSVWFQRLRTWESLVPCQCCDGTRPLTTSWSVRSAVRGFPRANLDSGTSTSPSICSSLRRNADLGDMKSMYAHSPRPRTLSSACSHQVTPKAT
ncbi:hypothetical protein LXA43DRAFT_738059 [Ganoderma leucocontextum]|nr:hypothetical protein LXA43DRAFT_738059 [Ganoderma leucocontextum]